MIKLYKYLNVYDFRNEFSGLDNTAWADEWQALGVLFNHLEDLGGEMLAAKISDWLRFEVMEMTEEEIEKNYSLQFVGYSTVEYFLNDYTILYGTYEHDGITYYLFGEF